MFDSRPIISPFNFQKCNRSADEIGVMISIEVTFLWKIIACPVYRLNGTYTSVKITSIIYNYNYNIEIEVEVYF